MGVPFLIFLAFFYVIKNTLYFAEGSSRSIWA